MKSVRQRVISIILVMAFALNIVDVRILSELFTQLRASAAVTDYAVGFKWDLTGLGESDNVNRYYTLSADGTELYLKEMKEENPVLKTTFSFNLAKAIEPGNLTFTITGLDSLIRNGTLDMIKDDPNIVGTWDIKETPGKDEYTFTNNVRVTSNNETTFTWPFNSRAAVDGSEITLETEVSVTEQWLKTTIDPDTNEEKTEVVTSDKPIIINTNSLKLKYESVHDENEVKIVCKDLNNDESDFNNLNTDYDWRTYYSVLGLKGLTEYNKRSGEDRVATDNIYDAHIIEQSTAEQNNSLKARGINTSDYFIEVDPGAYDKSDIMVVDASGSRVELSEYTINGETLYGFYVFNGQKDREPGQSYSCNYHVGVLNTAVKNKESQITLTGHYLVTYNDDPTVYDITDSAAHKLSKDDKQPVGSGGTYMVKYNKYEINYGTTYSDHKYESHARHYSPANQLLFDNIFNGKTVEYSLTASSPQITEGGEVKEYDLIYEDGAPEIKNLKNDKPNRKLAYDEYDFTRILVKKLINGNTVSPDGTANGFNYDIYGKSNDPADTSGWIKLEEGNTLTDKEFYLPADVDEIRLVVRDFKIRADIQAYVDISYFVNENEYDNIYIDTDHIYEGGNSVNGDVKEDTNKGTILVNSFTRKQYVGDYNINESSDYTYSNENTVHSNTWLRDSVTTVDSDAKIEAFKYHTASNADETNYYTTTITSGGTVQSDTQKALKKFAVYSRVPEHLTMSENWLSEFLNTLSFSGTLLGGSVTVDEDFVLANNALSAYYDEETGCVVAEFDFDGFALDAGALTSVSFSYPTEITLIGFNSLDEKTVPFITDTYVTVLDDNVRLSAKQGKTLVSSDDSTNPTGKDASKFSAKASISALGAQKNNYTEKYVSSYYTEWLNDNSAEVDGSNSEHLDTDTNRMTSDYTYKMNFHRFSTDLDEKIINPVIVDIVDGRTESAWHGYVKTVTFDDDSYPARDAGSGEGFEPKVYYLLRSSGGVTEADSGKYKYAYAPVDEAIADFTNYSSDDTEHQDVLLEKYGALMGSVNGWNPAVKNDDGSFTINHEDVYAVAIVYEGTYTKTEEMLDLTAYLNMRAPALSNDKNSGITNNRVAYNDIHTFAKGINSQTEEQFPMYTGSKRTMVTLRHNIELMKVSSANTNKRLSGAKFNVYNANYSGELTNDENIVDYYKKRASEPEKMRDVEVDISGVLRLNLSPGIYYYQETKAPVGYYLDDSVYRFRAVSDENSVYYYTTALKTEGERDYEYVVVNAREYNTYGTSVYSGKTPVGTDKPFYIFDSDNNKVAYLSGMGGVYEYRNDPDNINLNTVCCDAYGKVTVKNLPAGTYYLGSAADDPDRYPFSVADNSEISFYIFKKSAITNDVNYELYEMQGDSISANDKACVLTGSGSSYAFKEASDADSATKIVPDGDGKVVITGLDPSKKYYFKNTAVPKGYKLASEQIVTPGTGVISLYSTEQLEKTECLVVEDDPIDTAKARFEKIDATMYGGQESENYGTLLNGAKYILYYVEEDGSESPVYFVKDSDNTYLMKGTSGAAGYTTLLETATVGGRDGAIELRGLQYGTYAIQEAEAPASYQLNPEKRYFYVMASTINPETYYVKFTENDGGTAIESEKMTLEDNEVMSNIVLTKVDFENTDNYLADAAYRIYRLKSNTSDEVTAEEYLAAAKEAATASMGVTSRLEPYWAEYGSSEPVYTSANGTITFTGLPFGTYLLYEDLAPRGYKWNNDLSKWETWSYNKEHTHDCQVIVIDKESVALNSSVSLETIKGEDNTETVTEVRTYHAFYARHLDERKTGEARLIKRNADNLGLTDGVFALYKVNLTSEEIDAVLSRSGYKDEAISAMSDADKKEALNKIELTVSDVDVSKHFDTTAGAPKKESDAYIDTVIKQSLKTNGNPATRGSTEKVQGLEWGVYYFYEVKPPSGYELDKTPHLFAVNADSAGATIDVDVVDEKIYGEVWLYKQDKSIMQGTTDNHAKLFGAQFELYTNTDKQIKAVPILRLTYDDTTGTNQTSLFLVSDITVLDKTNIKITLKDGGTLLVTYQEGTDEGNVLHITAQNDFMEKYNTPENLDSGIEDFRVAYYAVTQDGKNYFDPYTNKYRALVTDSEKDGYEEDQKVRECITGSFFTVNKGGRLNVRGLDWDSYYFKETVPPEGYGLADKVVFAVNSYNCTGQFIRCDDPKAAAAIIIDKEIPKADAAYIKDKGAFGEPSFMFKVYELAEAGGDDTVAYTEGGTNYKKTGKEYTVLIHLSEVKTLGTKMINVPLGKYLIEEIPVSRYECTGLELIKAEESEGQVKVKKVGETTKTSTSIANDASKYEIRNGDAVNSPWTAFCDLTKPQDMDDSTPEMLAFHIKYTNAIKRYDSFSQVTYVDNPIPEMVYVTSFKPNYTSLVDVYTGSDTSHVYQINLASAMTADEGQDPVFEAVLTYNNGTTKKLTAEELGKLKFKTPTDYGNVVLNDDGVLKLTTDNPSGFAGQTIQLDVGYSDSATFTEYDVNNTSMVRGTLSLTFGEIPVANVKKVVLKNDVANRSYFQKDDSSPKETTVAVIYTKSADGTSVTKTLENTAQTDTLTVASGYELKYWYLLDGDGKPVTDEDDNIVQYADEDAIKAYIFSDSNANVNTFTFQAAVEKVTKPTAKLKFGNSKTDFRDFLQRLSDNNGNLKAFKRVDYSIGEAAYTNATRKEIISVSDETYPDEVYAYSEVDSDGKYTINWFSKSKRVLLSGDYSYMFNGHTGITTAITDVSGIIDFDFSEVTKLSDGSYGAFERCYNLEEITFNTDLYSLEQVANLFKDCNVLSTVTFQNERVNLKSLKSARYMFMWAPRLSQDELRNILIKFDFSENELFMEEFNTAKTLGRSDIPNNDTSSNSLNEIKFFGYYKTGNNFYFTDYNGITYRFGSNLGSNHNHQVPIPE